MGSLSRPLRGLASCLAMVLAVVFVSPAAGQGRLRAVRVLEREQQILRAGFVKPVPGLPRLLSLEESTQALKNWPETLNLLSRRPTEAGPPVPGSFRFGLDPEADCPVWVVEDDLMKLPVPAFMNAVAFLRALQGRARAYGRPGPLSQGLAAAESCDLLYQTSWAWSLADREEAAAWYLLVALNGGKFIGLNPGGGEVRSLLGRFYGRGENDPVVKAATSLLLDPPAQRIRRPGRRDLPDDPDEPPFRLERILAPEVRGVFQRESGARRFREGAARLVEEITEAVRKGPKAYGHLAFRYRLLRNLRAVAAGREAVVAARARAKGGPLPTAEKPDPTAPRRLAALCETWVSWFEAEVKRRGNGKRALAAPRAVSWDPYALSELFALVIEHSVPYAELVRVPVAEGKVSKRKDLEDRVKAAFKADPFLERLCDRFGAPIVEVVPDPAAPTGQALVLRWELVPPGGGTRGEVLLQFEAAFSRGGSGLPVEPGLADSQSIPACAALADAPVPVRLRALTPPALVETVAGLKKGPDDPPRQFRWHPVARKRSFDMALAVVVTLGKHGQIAGTASQEVWGRTAGASDWDWAALGMLVPGDQVWSVKFGACPVTAVRLVPASSSFTRLTLAGNDNTSINTFVVRCNLDPVVVQARHGIEASTPVPVPGPGPGARVVPLGKIKLDPARRQFVRLDGFSQATAEVVRRKDLLVKLTPDHIEVLYEIVYTVDGKTGSIRTAYSHGFLAVRNGRKVEVAAHDLIVGDDLVVREEAASTARVTRIAIVTAPAGQSFELVHPRLLRCAWIHAGVLVHADRYKAQQPGLLPSSRISLARQPGGAAGPWRVGKAVAVSGLRAGEEALGCWPGASIMRSQFGEFLGRRVDRVSSDVSADMVRLITGRSQQLTCAAGTLFWRQEGEPEQKRVHIKTVKAAALRKGDKILALKSGDGPAALEMVTIVSTDLIDAFEHLPEKGFFEICLPELTESKSVPVATFEKRYDNLFANGLLVALAAGEYQEKDKIPPSPLPGKDGPGKKARPARQGVVTGKRPEPVIPTPESPLREVALEGIIVDPRARPLPRFDAGEVALLQRSLDTLNRAFRELLKKELPPPVSSLEQEDRWDRFARAFLPAPFQDRRRALRKELLLASFQLYADYRRLLIQTGHPDGLRAAARIGIPLSYIFHDCGGPEVARLLLNDLLTFEMRLALRPGKGEALWRQEGLVRDSVRYCLEYARLDTLVEEKGGSAAARFWGVTWACESWADLLAARVKDGDLHQDVLNPKTRSTEGVMLYNLLVQMDRHSGVGGPVVAFLGKDFRPGTEFEGEVAQRFGRGK
jgi:hypothetical protein